MRPLRVFWGAVLVSAALAAGFLVTSGSGQQPTSFAHVMDRRCRGGCTDTALLRVLPQVLSTQIAMGTLTTSKGATVTVTRASAKTCSRPDGGVVKLGNNVPCVEVNGLSMEDATSNAMLRSEQLDVAPWSATGSTTAPTVTADACVAPDGTTTAEQVAFPAVSGASAFSIVSQSFTAAATIYVADVYMKAVSGTPTLSITLTNGTTYYTGTCSPNALGYIRCATPGPIDAVASTVGTLSAGSWTVRIGVDLRDAQQSAKGAQSVCLWGTQVSPTSWSHSYIPTVASIAATDQDLLSVSVPGATKTNGCFRALVTPMWTGSNVGGTVAGFYDGSATGSILINLPGTTNTGINDGTTAANVFVGWAGGVTAPLLSSWNAGGNTKSVILLPNTSSTYTSTTNASAGFSTLGAGPYSLTSSVKWAWLRDLQWGPTASSCDTSIPSPYVVAMGDSITQGVTIPTVTVPWPTRVAVLKTKYVLNDGVWGERTDQIATRWNNGLATKGETWMTYMGGVNDIISAIPNATALANLQAVTDDALAHGIKVALLTLTPCGGLVGCDATVQANITSFNTSLSTYASAHPGTVTLVDANALLRNAGTPTQLAAAYDSGDHLHPNQAGMDVIGNAVAAVIP